MFRESVFSAAEVLSRSLDDSAPSARSQLPPHVLDGVCSAAVPSLVGSNVLSVADRISFAARSASEQRESLALVLLNVATHSLPLGGDCSALCRALISVSESSPHQSVRSHASSSVASLCSSDPLSLGESVRWCTSALGYSAHAAAAVGTEIVRSCHLSRDLVSALLTAATAAICSPTTSNADKRMISRTLLAGLLDMEPSSASALWASLSKPGVPPEVALLVVVPSSKHLLGDGTDVRKDQRFWDALFSVMERPSDNFAKNCASFLIQRASAGTPESGAWQDFLLVHEALDTHATELIRSAFRKLVALVSRGAAVRLPPRWPAMLFAKALSHFHAPCRRGVVSSFLTSGASGIGSLADDATFVSGVAMKALCEPLLYHGELGLAAQRLVSEFLESFFGVHPVARVLEWYLRAITSTPVVGRALIVHCRFLAQFALSSDSRAPFVADEQLVHALLEFARAVTEAEHFVVRRLCCSLFLSSLPAIIRPPGLLTFDGFRRIVPCLRQSDIIAPESPEFRAVALLACAVPPRGQWLSQCLGSAVSQFIREQDPLCDTDTISRNRARAQDISFLFAFVSEDHEAVGRILEPAVSTCKKIYSHPYLATGAAERALTLMGRVTELVFAKGGAPSSTTRSKIAEFFEECAEECFAFVDHRLSDPSSAFLDRVMCCADWLAGCSLSGQLRPNLRARGWKLASALVQRLTCPTWTTTGRIAALSLLHALVARGRLAVCNPELCSAVLQNAPSSELPLPKVEAVSAEGMPWLDRLAEGAKHAFEILNRAAAASPVPVFPPPLSIHWDGIASIARASPSPAGLAAMLATLGSWAAAGVLPAPNALDELAGVSFGLFAEFAFDRAVMREWIGFVFQPRFVSGAAFQAVVTGCAAKVLSLGERSLLAVNWMADKLVEGWVLQPAIAEESCVPLIVSILGCGQIHSSKDSSGVFSSAFDDEVDVGATSSEPAEESTSRARDTRDHYARAVLLAFVRGGPASLAEKVAIACAAQATDSVLTARKMPLFSPEHRKQLRLLQAVCVLAPRLGREAAGADVTKSLLGLACDDAHATSRTLCVVGLGRLCLACPARIAPLVELLKDLKTKTLVLHAAVATIGAVVVNLPGSAGDQMIEAIFPVLLPHISGPLSVRVTAQAIFATLLGLGRIPRPFEPIAGGIAQMLIGLDDCDRVLLTCWPGINAGRFLRCGIDDLLNGIVMLFEGFPRAEVVSLQLCRALEARFGVSRSGDGASFAGPPVCLVPRGVSVTPSRFDAVELENWGGPGETDVGEVQRKPTPWNFGDEEEVSRHMRRACQDLIIVASLVDKPPNLGGMCRVTDIFNLRELVVSDLRVRETPQFMAASVTAERWVPMSEVTEEQLPRWLEKKRGEGYTVFGVEQTTESVLLNRAAFPKRSILVLGKEQSGLPANLIALCDQCIEIPQLGIIRSLNVHVTTSLVVWEYSKQHAFRQQD